MREHIEVGYWNEEGRKLQEDGVKLPQERTDNENNTTVEEEVNGRVRRRCGRCTRHIFEARPTTHVSLPQP